MKHPKFEILVPKKHKPVQRFQLVFVFEFDVLQQGVGACFEVLVAA